MYSRECKKIVYNEIGGYVSDNFQTNVPDGKDKQQMGLKSGGVAFKYQGQKLFQLKIMQYYLTLGEKILGTIIGFMEKSHGDISDTFWGTNSLRLLTRQ